MLLMNTPHRVSPTGRGANVFSLVLLAGLTAGADVIIEDPPNDAYSCRYVNDTLYQPAGPGYLDVLMVVADIAGDQLEVHITTREDIPTQASGVYVFQCFLNDPARYPAGRLLVGVLGQSEPKYGTSPATAAVAGAVVGYNPGTWTKLSAATLLVTDNTLTLRTPAGDMLQPECLYYVSVRYYHPDGDAYGEPVDTVVVRTEPDRSTFYPLGPTFVGAVPGQGRLLGPPVPPAEPPQKKPWFSGGPYECPPEGPLPSPPNGDRDIDNDGNDDWFYERSPGGSELRGWDDPPAGQGGDDSFVVVIPIPGTGGYKFIGGCRWPGGKNDAWIDEGGLAHWRSTDPSTGRRYHWIYNPLTGKLRLWCGWESRPFDGWIGHDWADPPEDLNTYFTA